MSENGESKTFEISSREEKEIGVNKFVSGKGKQEIVDMNSGNYDMQQRSITYVPFNSLILSEGTMFVHGLDGIRKNTKPFGRWLNSILKKIFSRYKRDSDQQDKHILKHPSIFENIRDEVPIQSKKPRTPIKKKILPNQNIPKTYIQVQNTPSSLYKVPPSITSKTPNDWNNIPEKTPNRFYEVPVNKPSSFYEVHVNTPSSFYEVPLPYEYPDSTLDPATVIQMLQQEG